MGYPVRKKYRTVEIVFFAFISWILTTTAPSALAQSGPSFDCSKSSSYMEKQICQSAKLSEFDLKLDTSYRAAVEMLSPTAKKALQNSQRSWLKFVRTVCNSTSPPSVITTDTEGCLAEKLQERERQLRATTVKNGVVTIYPFGTFIAHQNSTDDQSGHDSGYSTTQVSYPQMEGPDSSFKSRFNAAHAMFASKIARSNPEETDTDYFADYRILTANSNLLSVEVSGGFYAHGTPHGQYYSLIFNWLPREGRALHPTDIFASSKPWQRFVQSFCYKKLMEEMGEVWGGPDLNSFIKNLGPTIVDPKRWRIDQKGLEIHFLTYEVAAYVAGEPKVVVPWEQLRDYLAPDAGKIFNQ
ncbi:DUF3298 domain-containing protein [Herbaspirillum huttiense]|uniref:DUF3298 domain-containing protein n=1 Tax=Herbaspirillum huttiense TaxID=863372 RepID=UPI0021769747|nr:DUF3298 domain-containing protein [Herbaspirillum huttiense]UWE15246.1 lysozyme inhibitor LprI family protein [Herbaspirillum huttiense]